MKNRVKWIQDNVKKSDSKGVIVAISGGIDSAVVAALAVRAFPKNSLGIFIDIESSQESIRNFLRVVHSIGINNATINLTDTYNKFLVDSFELGNPYSNFQVHKEFLETGIVEIDKSYLENKNIKIIKGNVKARLRMSAIYAQAQKNNYLVLETSNKSELEIGYYTKWGDGVGDISPISDLTKSQVYELAAELQLPQIVIDAKPSADLWADQTDEEELGFTYNDLEKYLNNSLTDNDKKDKIESMKNRNRHKLEGVIKYNG